MNDEVKVKRQPQYVWILLFLTIFTAWTAFGEEIHYYCGDTNSTSTTIIPLLKLNNNTAAAVQWSSLEIRYYFTKDDTVSTYRFICESAPVDQGLQASQVSGTIINISGSDYYLKITFNSTSSIPANTLTGAMIIKVYIDNSQIRNQSNDYSFNAGYTSYAAWNQITLYKNSTLIWGVAPGTVGGGEDPTAVPTTEPATPDPTAVSTSEPVTPDPTSVPTDTLAPTVTPGPTSIPTTAPVITDDPTTPPTVTAAPTTAPSVTVDPTAVPGSGQYIWIEAESCAAYWPQILSSDTYADYSASDCASEEKYLAVLGGENALELTLLPTPPGTGNIDVNFTTSTTGTYRIWARVKTPDTNSDSWWVKMDSGAYVKWDNIGPYSSWAWAITGDYSLAAGSHTLTFVFCEDGALLDKILITNDTLYSPTGFGDPIPTPAGGNTYRRSDMVDVNGNLQVIGKNLCNKNGSVIQLRGINTHGPQWYPVTTNYTIPNLTQTWGIDIVRIAMYIEDFKDGNFWNGYLAHKDDMKQMVKGYVDDAISAGIYVIIDWHIHNYPPNFTQDAKDFFAEMSATYGGYANVLFEICNEPIYTDWSVIKSYAQEVIPMIRNNDPDGNDNIIIVGTPSWSQDVDVAAASPLTGFTNIIYALHFYADTHTQPYRDKVSTALSLNLPILATEWSACDYNVSKLNFTEAQIWVDFLNANNISYIFWSFCNRDDKSAVLKPGISMTGPWSDAELTEQGLWIKARM